VSTVTPSVGGELFREVAGGVEWIGRRNLPGKVFEPQWCGKRQSRKWIRWCGRHPPRVHQLVASDEVGPGS